MIENPSPGRNWIVLLELLAGHQPVLESAFRVGVGDVLVVLPVRTWGFRLSHPLFVRLLFFSRRSPALDVRRPHIG